jgi:hypothetical protein
MIVYVVCFTLACVLVSRKNTAALASLFAHIFFVLAVVPALDDYFRSVGSDSFGFMAEVDALRATHGAFVLVPGNGSANLVAVNSGLQSALQLSNQEMLLLMACMCVASASFVAGRLAGSRREVQFGSAIVYFAPSMLLWTSLYGKDGWSYVLVLLAVGALLRPLQTGRWRARDITPLMVSMLGLFFLRPYLGIVIAIAGAIVAKGSGSSFRSIALRIAMVAVALVLLGVQLQALQGGNVLERLASLQETNQRGGSAFGTTTGAPSSYLGLLGNFPATFAALAVRPTPFEATSLEKAAASAEVVLIIGFYWLYVRRDVPAPSMLEVEGRRRVGRFAILAVLLYALGQSAVAGNVGTTARLRVSILPAVVLLPYLRGRRNESAAPTVAVSSGEQSGNAPGSTLRTRWRTG